MEPQTATQARFSIPSILALVLAIASFATGAIWGLVLAIGAIILGAIGVFLAFSSRVRGGIMSTMAVLAGFIGIIAAVIKAVGALL